MIPYKEKLKVISYSHVFNIVARGGGGFDFLLKAISYSTKWPGGVADLISYGDKLKAISHSTKCSEKVGGF